MAYQFFNNQALIYMEDVFEKQTTNHSLLDNTLSGKDMAEKFLEKVNGKLKFIYRQSKYLNKRLRRMLCNTIIQPHFDYASSAWYLNLNKNLKSKLQIAQNKCILFCLYLENILKK